MKRLEDKRRRRERRRIRVRKRIAGTPERPRMTVFRSNRYTYVQVVDDSTGNTLCAVCNASKDNRAIRNTATDVGKLGELIGGELKKLKISKVVFDRNGYSYHGLVRAVAEGARKAGIEL